jgi:hypothetical protein
MNDDLGIALRVEIMAALFQVPAQFGEVVDLSVENDPDVFLFVVDGLMPAGKVDDAQSPHPQADGTLGIDAFIVRAAVHDRLTHAVNVGGVNGLAGPAHHSGYSAHWATSAPSRSARPWPPPGRVPCTAMGCSITRRSSRPQLSNQRKTSS